jgi:hypothetical protein
VTTLDAPLANRLPDVELLTAGGSGVPVLAASIATGVTSLLVFGRTAMLAPCPMRRRS